MGHSFELDKFRVGGRVRVQVHCTCLLSNTIDLCLDHRCANTCGSRENALFQARSKRQLQAKLNLPRRAGTEDLAEVWREGETAWRVEVWCVDEKLERVAVKLFGAGFRGDADERRSLAAKLSRVSRLLNLELLNRIHRRIDDEIVEILVRDFHAVDEIDVVTAALTGHVHQIAGLLKCAAACPAWWFDDAFAEQRELNKLPAVERQFGDAPAFDDVADFARRRLQQLLAHRDGFGNVDISRFKFQIHVEKAS